MSKETVYKKQTMKNKFKYLRRQFKRLPKPIRITVGAYAMLLLMELFLLFVTSTLLHFTIAFWIGITICFIVSYEKKIRRTAILHYFIGKRKGVLLVKEAIENYKKEDEDTIRINLN